MCESKRDARRGRARRGVLAIMGNAPSSEPPPSEMASGVVGTAAEPIVFELPPPPPPKLSALPPDVLRLVAARLSLPALSSLASTCSELSATVGEFDDLFGNLLEHHVGIIAERMSRAPDAEDDELVALVARLASPAAGDCREGCSLLSAHVCVLCGSRTPSHVYFPLTRRGICGPCVNFRPGHSERWRRAQFQREGRARQRADDATRRALGAIADALPLSVRRSSSVASVTRLSQHGHHPSATAGPAAIDDDDEVRMRLLFDASRHGGSSAALLRAAEGARYTVLLVHAKGGGRFGAFIDEPWDKRSVKSFFGGRGCFLYRLGGGDSGDGGVGDDGDDGDDGGGGGQLHRPTGLDAHYVHASSTHGLGFGGTLGRFGLSIEADLTRGRCQPSMTYGSGASALADEADFLCETVQLWRVETPAESELLRRSKRNPWEDDDDTSALEPGENKLMLEFIGMDKEVAMLRRFT